MKIFGYILLLMAVISGIYILTGAIHQLFVFIPSAFLSVLILTEKKETTK